MIIIGLTGSIGMGKTTVAGMLESMDVPVHEADMTVHYLLGAGGAAVDAVARHFPETLVKEDNVPSYIDRQVLGQIVFADSKKKKKLEGILHPLVRTETDKFVAYKKTEGHKVVALDIPLLFETGGERRVDVIICVSAPADTQYERVISRPGMTEEKLQRILAVQMPDIEKRKRSDYVVETGFGKDETRGQLAGILKTILETEMVCG